MIKVLPSSALATFFVLVPAPTALKKLCVAPPGGHLARALARPPQRASSSRHDKAALRVPDSSQRASGTYTYVSGVLAQARAAPEGRARCNWRAGGTAAAAPRPTPARGMSRTRVAMWPSYGLPPSGRSVGVIFLIWTSFSIWTI